MSDFKDRYTAAHEKIRWLELDYGLLKIHAEHTATLLESCETALASRDEEIVRLNEYIAMIEAIA